MLSNNTNDMLGEYTDPLNFKATEKINAGYAQLQTNISKIQIISGLRIEHTQQGYEIEYSASAITGTEPAGIQEYYDLLPSLHLRYALNTRTNIRASYYKAINRPSFFEIVPYRKEFEDYEEQGNPNVKRTVGHNIDLRWEYFPRPSEQFMVGLFYKQLKNPIEYAFDNIGMRSYYTPMNFGTSYNTGLEIDMTKYFRWLGIKTNYTFTHSQITTNKWFFTPQEEIEDVKQTRPLFGQAAHVANLSLLYKGLTNGWDAQLALSYTGKRLTNISHWIDQDWWQDGYFRLDASIDKQFTGTGITAFAKANNLLNTAMYQYINKNNMHDVLSEDYMRRQGGILERIEYYGTTITIGLKYKF
jgi:TonB-dependent receptor